MKRWQPDPMLIEEDNNEGGENHSVAQRDQENERPSNLNNLDRMQEWFPVSSYDEQNVTNPDVERIARGAPGAPKKNRPR